MNEPFEPPLDDDLVRNIARVHKRALGLAVGLTAAFVLFMVTAGHVLVRVESRMPLELLDQYFSGYDVSWTGAAVGAGWAFATGFVIGWFAGFLHNLVLALWLLSIRVRTDLSSTRDFLDHI